MGMKEPPASKGNAVSKGRQQSTDRTDKKVGEWKGGALGGNAGHSDKRPPTGEGKGAAPKHAPNKDGTVRTSVTGGSDPLATKDEPAPDRPTGSGDRAWSPRLAGVRRVSR